LDCQRSDPKQASGGAHRRQKTPGGIIPFRWAASSRFGGRHHSVTTGDIISFWWATSSGISTLDILSRLIAQMLAAGSTLETSDE
jgi:hypothetical protein